MGLPVYSGVEEALKMLNIRRMNALEHEKTDEGKLARKMWTLKWKLFEKRQREQWNKSEGGEHDYIGTGSVDTTVLKICRYSCTSHFKTTHKKCPFNKGTMRYLEWLIQRIPRKQSWWNLQLMTFLKLIVINDEYDSDIDWYDSSEYDSDMDIEELAYEKCDCPNYPSHQHLCFLNPKKSGWILESKFNMEDANEDAKFDDIKDKIKLEDSSSNN